jgi:DNA-binding transcriptional ArsR family regulator
MRPLYHPPPSEITVEGILYALSDPIRVRIYAEIARADCPQICSTFLQLDERKVPKSTLSVHFKVLREAGLIRSERRGVELHNSSRCSEIDERFDGLVSAIISAYQVQTKEALNAKSGVQGPGRESPAVT